MLGKMQKRDILDLFTSIFVGLSVISVLLFILSVFVLHNESGAVVAAIMLAPSVGLVTTSLYVRLGKQISSKLIIPMAISNFLLFTTGIGFLFFSWLNALFAG